MADNHDDEQHNVQFEGTSSGASLTYPMQCSALRKNGHVHLVAIDIFTGKKLEDLSPSTHNMDVPNIKRVEYTLVNIDDGFLNLLDADSNQKDDVKLPEGELGQKMEADFEDGKDLLVTVIASMGEEAAISYKEAPKTD
ncbi:Eukaryotic translation initiation factor 5A [Linnemannia zychae]|nr:Eukaryotic translation initiation factor 5A [Linnemannia zychae]